MYKHKKDKKDTSIMNFVKPYSKRKQFCPLLDELPEVLTFDILTFFRFFHNPNLGDLTSTNIHQYHILFNLLESELRIMQTDMNGIELKNVIFSSISCSSMRKFLRSMHGFDLLPISHPNGYRQVVFQDLNNTFGFGYTALFLHTSPHK